MTEVTIHKLVKYRKLIVGPLVSRFNDSSELLNGGSVTIENDTIAADATGKIYDHLPLLPR